MKFGLMFFSSTVKALGPDHYRLVRESACFGDNHGFSSIWVPERHFTEFGCLYPSPAVLQASLAAITSRIRLNAGSVVVPLHDPIRIAEEWAMVDHLSKGRVGLSFASGWNPNDFAFFPQNYERRHEILEQGIQTIRSLWRGEPHQVTNGIGEAVTVQVLPRPLQKELPFYLTAAGNPETYRKAGAMGANLLTHILDQGVEQLGEKIAIYRQARADAGFDPNSGEVSVMIHTYVGQDTDATREAAREPFCNFFKSNVGLLKGLARSRGEDIDISSLSPTDLDQFVDFLYERFALSRGLIGNPESCMPLLESLADIGVDEVACLLDFGPHEDQILANLPHLLTLTERFEKQAKVSRPQFQPRHLSDKSPTSDSLDEIRTRCPQLQSGEDFARMLAKHGVVVEGAFQGIRSLLRGEKEALGEIQMPQSAQKTGVSPYDLHPALLDACSQVFGATLGEDGDQRLYLPVGIRELRVHGTLGTVAWSHARLVRETPNVEGDIRIYDEHGKLAVEILGLNVHSYSEKAARVLAASLKAPQTPRVDQPFYAVNWHQLPSQVGTPLPDEGRWILLADQIGYAQALAEKLAAAGQTCCLIPTSASLSPTDELGLKAALRNELARSSKTVDGIIHLWGLDSAPGDQLSAGELESGAGLTTTALLHLVRAVAAEPELAKTRIWSITQSAQTVLDSDRMEGLIQAPLWSLGKVAAVEHAGHWGGLIDLQQATPPDLAAENMIQALARPGEPLCAYRNNSCYVARLRATTVAESPSLELNKDANYLITGGLGGLGQRLALWLADKGARHLTLISRSVPNESHAATLDRLAAMGVTVRVESLDLARGDQLARAFENLSKMPPLEGVFHLAGFLEDAAITTVSGKAMASARAAKVEGSWHLHRLTQNLNLKHFVMFSSAATLVSMPGQAAYSAANGFLDGLAHFRRGQGLPGLSINWGPFSEAGHAQTEYGQRAHQALAAMGIAALKPEYGFAAMETLIQTGSTQMAVLAVDWSSFLAHQSPTIPFLTGLSGGMSSAGTTSLLQELAALSLGERRTALSEFLARQITRVMRLEQGREIAPKRPLFEMGMDSIMALELKNTLAASLGRELNATLLFRHPTLEALTSHLSEMLPLEFLPEKYFASQQLPIPEQPHVELNAQLDDMSEEDILSLLNQEMENS